MALAIIKSESEPKWDPRSKSFQCVEVAAEMHCIVGIPIGADGDPTSDEFSFITQ
jgi:hypothetical protein